MNTEFEPKSDVPEQPTVPPMPEVKPPKGREISGCLDCRHFECDSEEYPCSDCKHTFHAKSENEHFSPINENRGDINLDFSFEGRQRDHFDVMVRMIGIQNARDLCYINAIMHINMSKKKCSVDEAENAVWYLNKLIGLLGTEKSTDKKE